MLVSKFAEPFAIGFRVRQNNRDSHLIIYKLLKSSPAKPLRRSKNPGAKSLSVRISPFAPREAPSASEMSLEDRIEMPESEATMILRASFIGSAPLILLGFAQKESAVGAGCL